MSSRARIVAATLCALTALAPAARGTGLLDDLLEQVEQIQQDTLGALVEQADNLLGRLDERQEAAMGRAAAAVLLGAAPLLENEAAEHYVNRVGRWVALQSERPDLDWRFGILDDDTVNAFAAPGGYVFVTRGLFLILRSEAELAGVLGHEIAHVVARHHEDVLGSKALIGELSNIAADASAQIDIFSEELSSVAQMLVASIRNLYVSGLEQGDELEADRMGAVLAARAGYQPFGLQHVLMTMEGLARESNVLDFLLSTHPRPRARLDALEQAIGPTLDGLGGASPGEPLAQSQASLRLS